MLIEGKQFNNEVFLNIVNQSFQGDKCRKWTQVARLYHSQTGHKIMKTQKLRRKYEILTGQLSNVTNDQKMQMLLKSIKYCGNDKESVLDYNKSSNNNMYQGTFHKIVGQISIDILNSIFEIFHLSSHKQNQHLNSKYTNGQIIKISSPSIFLLIKAQYSFDIQQNQLLWKSMNENEKVIANDLIKYSIIMKNIMNTYYNWKDYDRPQRYEYLSKYLNRNKFKKLLFYLKYLDILKKISINKHIKYILFSHPLIFNIIENNKKSLIYQTIIIDSDWQEKLNMYNECIQQQLQNDISLCISNQNIINNNNNEIYIIQKENKIFNKPQYYQAKILKKKQIKQIQKFRGQFLFNPDYQSQSRLTRKFNLEDDSEYDYERENSNLQTQQQLTKAQQLQCMNEIYHIAFENIPNQKQRHYYQDK